MSLENALLASPTLEVTRCGVLLINFVIPFIVADGVDDRLSGGGGESEVAAVQVVDLTSHMRRSEFERGGYFRRMRNTSTTRSDSGLDAEIEVRTQVEEHSE